MNTIGLMCLTSSHTFFIPGPSTQLGMLWAPPPTLCMGLCSPLLHHLCRKAFPNMSKWGPFPASPGFSIASLYFFHRLVRTCNYFLSSAICLFLVFLIHKTLIFIRIWTTISLFIIESPAPVTLPWFRDPPLSYYLFFLYFLWKYILMLLIGINIYQLKITTCLKKKKGYYLNC